MRRVRRTRKTMGVVELGTWGAMALLQVEVVVTVIYPGHQNAICLFHKRTEQNAMHLAMPRKRISSGSGHLLFRIECPIHRPAQECAAY